MYKLLTFLILALPLFAEDTPSPTESSSKVESESKKEPQSESPEAFSLKKNMESLFVDSKNVNHAHKATRQKARTSIDTAMDWEKAAQLCLGLSEWKKQAKRDEFKKLLHEVVGKTAYSRLDKFWKDGTTYQFLPLEIKGNDAHVSALYSVNASQFKIEYFLTKKETKWLIYDVAYEGERYSTNINDQIEAFLRENSFSTLLDKLRKRLAELETNENKGKGKK